MRRRTALSFSAFDQKVRGEMSHGLFLDCLLIFITILLHFRFSLYFTPETEYTSTINNIP